MFLFVFLSIRSFIFKEQAFGPLEVLVRNLCSSSVICGFPSSSLVFVWCVEDFHIKLESLKVRGCQDPRSISLSFEVSGSRWSVV